MHRLDPVCKHLKDSLASPELKPAEKARLEKELKAREEVIKPVYRQVAVMFADLHDTAGRMQEKGVICVSFDS